MTSSKLTCKHIPMDNMLMDAQIHSASLQPDHLLSMLCWRVVLPGMEAIHSVQVQNLMYSGQYAAGASGGRGGADSGCGSAAGERMQGCCRPAGVPPWGAGRHACSLLRCAHRPGHPPDRHAPTRLLPCLASSPFFSPVISSTAHHRVWISMAEGDVSRSCCGVGAAAVNCMV